MNFQLITQTKQLKNTKQAEVAGKTWATLS